MWGASDSQRALQFVFEFFDGNAGLLKNALKSLWSKSPMIGDRDLEGPAKKLNVPAPLDFPLRSRAASEP
jgi:hypothetical protein